MASHPSHMLLEPEAIPLLRVAGIPYPDCAVAASAAEAARLADGLGYPVVLKIVSPDAPHKSDVGGVAVGLESAAAVLQAYERITASLRERVPRADIRGALVCRQAPPALEVIVGALHDAMFGPTLMFGLGGIFAEVLGDVTFRVVPLQRADAQEMIREIKGYPLLAGARGRPACDAEALVDLLLAVSRLVESRPDIQELDLNPVRLYEQGLQVLDARIVLRGA